MIMSDKWWVKAKAGYGGLFPWHYFTGWIYLAEHLICMGPYSGI